MANGVLSIIDLWSSVHDSDDVLHVNHVHRRYDARGNVLHSTWSLLGKSNTICVLHTGTGMRNDMQDLPRLFHYMHLRSPVSA